jgi:hypothetical protein
MHQLGKDSELAWLITSVHIRASVRFGVGDSTNGLLGVCWVCVGCRATGCVASGLYERSDGCVLGARQPGVLGAGQPDVWRRGFDERCVGCMLGVCWVPGNRMRGAGDSTIGLLAVLSAGWVC